MRIYLVVLFSSFLLSCGVYREPDSNIHSNDAQCDGLTFREKLETCIEGLTVDSEEVVSEGLTRFMLRFNQPVDHNDPSLGRFSQVLMLLHRAEDRPMVLGTTGYSLYSKARMEPSILLDANQITVEHRFFASSTPESRDWSKLSIRQSADDFHRVVTEFKKIYTKKWINTGASKGGMTSVYHRYFYPGDVDGTVAYVAPHSLSDADMRYIDFLDTVGGADLTECRENLVKFQKKVLSRKTVLAEFAAGDFTHYINQKIGGLELAASELRFVFWQYGTPAKCEQLKNLEIDDAQLYTLFSEISGYPESYSDSSIDFFLAYYYQSGTELGGPSVDLVNIRDEIDHLENFSLEQFFPEEVELNYAPLSMLQVAQWVREQSSKIMFVYGEYDPWSAGAFDVGTSEERGSKFFVVPRGNHGSKIAALALQEKIAATKTLFDWANISGDSSDFNGLARGNFPELSDDMIERRLGLKP